MHLKSESKFKSLCEPLDSLSTFGDLMGGVDCVVFPEASNVQSFLENFVETVDSTYGCVLLKGHVVGMV